MKQNPFLRAIIAVVKWFPVVFITAVVLWSYYAYVVELSVREVQSTTEKAFYLIFYHIFFLLFGWSYWQCIFTNGGQIPAKFFLTPAQATDLNVAYSAKDYEGVKRLLEKFAGDLPVYTRGYNGDIRYCEKCQMIKPDRAHHCSVCERCILKMDHHCPWVNNCVCFDNYKFFLLFLGYAIMYCAYISLTDLQYFILFWKDELKGEGNKFHILFLFFVSTMFMISLVSLMGYHCFLTLTNRTTIESYRAPIFSGGTDKNGFNIGRGSNFTQVFGNQKALWFLPVFTSLGDGSEYPTRSSRTTAYQAHSTSPVQPFNNQYLQSGNIRDNNLNDGGPAGFERVSSSSRTVMIDANGNADSNLHHSRSLRNGNGFASVPFSNNNAGVENGDSIAKRDGHDLLDLDDQDANPNAGWKWSQSNVVGQTATERPVNYRANNDANVSNKSVFPAAVTSSSSASLSGSHLHDQHSHPSQLILLNEQY